MSKVLEALTDDNYNPLPEASRPKATHGVVTNHYASGKCSRCGECCGAVPMPITRKEEKKIREYIDKHNIPYQPSRMWKDIEGNINEELRCCFYDYDNKKCNIYPVRPSMCRRFRCNLSKNEIELNKVIHHERAYWNYCGLDTPMKNLTNFSLLFYDRYVDLYKWFIAQFRTELNLPLKESVEKTFEMFELGGIKLTPKVMNQLQKEIEEDNERANTI